MKCWMTIGFRATLRCSYCVKTKECREVSFSKLMTRGPETTKRVTVAVCDECWRENVKMETPPTFFPPERSMQVPLRPC